MPQGRYYTNCLPIYIYIYHTVKYYCSCHYIIQVVLVVVSTIMTAILACTHICIKFTHSQYICVNCFYYSQCEFVVPQIESPQHVQICHYCECKYESRNTTTIKVKTLFLNLFFCVAWGGQEGVRCCCLVPHALLCQC